MSTVRKKVRKEAQNLIRLADKVLAYRRDLIPADGIAEIQSTRDHLDDILGAKEEVREETVQKAMGRLDKVLRPYGGDIYPVTFFGENVEMLLVAAILAIGIRTFFLQPFKIPTNSMWPTYAGMTETVYSIDEAGPNTLEKVWNFATLGAVNYNQQTAQGGEVLVPFGVDFSAEGGPKAVVAYETFMGRKWFGLLPAPKRRYAIYVGGQAVVFEVPVDFSLDEVVRQTYFADFETLFEAFEYAQKRNRLVSGQSGGQAIRTGRTLQSGQSVLDFDIDTGDMLFVDRFSYNFVAPEVGDPIVFRTDHISGLVDRNTGAPAEQYYIKRLVGTAGDELEVRAPALYRNGAPIEGADAFQKNAEQVEEYPGYVAYWGLRPGNSVIVPVDFYYVMGDNSPHSFDSRGWGVDLLQKNPDLAKAPNLDFVPEKEVIGQAFFIFYPFSKRWGLAE